MSKKVRKSLYVRLQMNEGTPLDEVRSWLDSLDAREKNRKIEDVLVMCLLPYARLDSEKYNQDELSRTCLESCDTGNKHFSTLRQIFNLSETQCTSSVSSVSSFNQDSSRQSENTSENTNHLGQASLKDVDELFG